MSSRNTWGDITFPDCESDYNLGAIPADQNCLVVPKLSQVSDLYIQPDGADAPFAWTGYVASINENAVGNNVTNNTKSKWITGRGGIPAPAETIYQGHKLQKVIAERAYQLTFRTEVRSDSQRDFIRQLQSNWTEFVFWIGTLGGNLYGGPNGIEPYYCNAQLPLGAADDDFEIGIITIEFATSNGGIPVASNPLSNMTSGDAIPTVISDGGGTVIGDSSGVIIGVY